MHPKSLENRFIELNNSFAKLSNDYETLRLKFDKYVISSEVKLKGLHYENQELHDELSKQIRINEEQSGVIIELKRKLGLDNTNSSITSSKVLDFKKVKSKV